MSRKEEMSVVIFEACRSPEMRKATEALVLSQFFSAVGIDYEVYSNDGVWPERRVVDKVLIRRALSKCEPVIAHLAIHADDGGFVTRWSDDEDISNRVVKGLLTGDDIKAMDEWSGKLVVSGACGSARFVDSFLEAGAVGVVAPERLIHWTGLGKFFELFYLARFSGQGPLPPLSLAISSLPEFEGYRVFYESIHQLDRWAKRWPQGNRNSAWPGNFFSRQGNTPIWLRFRVAPPVCGGKDGGHD